MGCDVILYGVVALVALLAAFIVLVGACYGLVLIVARWLS